MFDHVISPLARSVLNGDKESPLDVYLALQYTATCAVADSMNLNVPYDLGQHRLALAREALYLWDHDSDDKGSVEETIKTLQEYWLT